MSFEDIVVIIRDSRYFGSCLRSKNATGWLHGEREPTSIGQARRRLVHPFAKHRQVFLFTKPSNNQDVKGRENRYLC